jgi:chorismate synthase
VAGGIALQVLEARGVCVAAHVAQVGNVFDERLETRDNSPEGQERLAEQVETLRRRAGEPFCTLSEDAAALMAEEVDRAREDGDSVGGAIECVCTGLPAGIGGPRYDGVQAAIARICFSLPAVRALEFGAGFDVASMRGSEANDPFVVRDGRVVPLTNNAGGTLGGISTGAPVAFRLAVKPTPSIACAQRSVDLATLEECELSVRGRHDPCVATRAVPIVEAACALAVLDSWLAFPPDDDIHHR